GAAADAAGGPAGSAARADPVACGGSAGASGRTVSHPTGTARRPAVSPARAASRVAVRARGGGDGIRAPRDTETAGGDNTPGPAADASPVGARIDSAGGGAGGDDFAGY